MNQEEKFNNYVETFKKLPLSKKKELTILEAKKTLAFTELVKNSVGAKKEMKLNKEVLDVSNGEITDDDFTEAMFVYLNSIRETVAITFNELYKITNGEEK